MKAPLIHRAGALLLLAALGTGTAQASAQAGCPDCVKPTVTLTSPTNGASVKAPATFTLTASVVPGDGAITKVEFRSGTTLLNTDTTAPYSYVWSGVVLGTYSLTAKVYDSFTNTGTSPTVTVTSSSNASPTVSLTSPINGATGLASASFTLTANAADSDGTISKVEFYANGVLINTDSASPFTYVYSGLGSGGYSFTAKAYDNLNATATSAAVAVSVNAPPTVALTSPTNGATGIAPASFTLAATAADSDGSISKVDFYSNGILLFSDTSTPYGYTYSSVGSGSYALTAKATDNLGAVTTSTTATVSVNALPTVSLTSPTNGATGIAPASFTLTANATDSDGSISKVEFYANGTLINTDSASPFSYVYSNVAVGNVALMAKAYDNLSASVTSATVNVSSVANNAPTVSLTSPANGASAVSPASFSLAATASDVDGSVAKVEFYSNGALIATDTTTPYTASLSSLTTGSYAFTAKATDNLGLATTSIAATVSVTSAGMVSVTRTYVYDANERLCKTINPESGATLVDYDGAGNIAWSADGQALPSASCDRASVAANAKTTRSYDLRNRLLALATPGGVADVTATYAPDGRVASLVAVNGALGANPVTTTYSYNKRRLLSQETSAQAGYLYTLGYGYTGNGHLATLTYPDTQVVAYAPDALGRATQVASPGGTTYASGISYYPNGAIHSFIYGNGIVHTMFQNTRLLPMRSLDANGAAKTLDDNYVFDGNGNVTFITDNAVTSGTNNRNRNLGYDGRDRLLVADAPNQWGPASYTYDAFDNIRTANMASPARSYRYSYDANNRLSQINDGNGIPQFVFGYDARGNVSNKGAQAYAFDIANRLTAVTGLQSYRYDGQGRRVQTTDADNVTKELWVYSQSGQVLYTSEARRNQNLSYYYLGNTQVATRAVAWGTGTVTVKYEHTDALGSPVVESSSTGVVAKRNTYAPYGEAYAPTTIDGTGYTGHVMDQATGLTYMQQRYYDPQTGRFLSVDPVGVSPVNGLNFNRYWYASNNPYTNKDPDGRCDGPSTCAIDRDIAAMNSGEMSRSEFMDRSEARGAGAILGVAMIAAVVSPNVRNGVITAGLETSMQAGKQMAVDGKAASEVTIDKSDVAVAGVIGAFAPGAITTLSQVRTSVSAIRTLGAQATNTAARAVKIAGRIQAHVSSLKTAVGAWVASKIATASTQEAVNKADELETKK